MFSHNMAFNYLCFILMLVCTKNEVVQSACVQSYSEQESLIPYGGSCNQSSQCITSQCESLCVCPVYTTYNNCTASCVLRNSDDYFPPPNWKKEDTYNNNIKIYRPSGSNVSVNVSVSVSVRIAQGCVKNSTAFFNGKNNPGGLSKLTSLHNKEIIHIFDCDVTAHQSSGQIVSPNYPYQYPNFASCIWTLRGNSNTYYVLSISDMDIESITDCIYDSLKIYDETSEGNTQLAMFCNGNDSSTKIVTSSGNVMQLVFKTDSSGQGSGFSGSYQSYDYNATIMDSKYGCIASPGYPLQYPANSYFSWTILGSSSSFISFSISDMDIEYSSYCMYDSLKIYDGTSEADTLLATFCNRWYTGTKILASSTNSMYLVFKANSSAQGKGFSGSYRIYEYNTTITKQQNGYIVSPGYPLTYPKNSYFSWTIQGSPGTYISLSFSDIDLKSSTPYDYLKIYNGTSENGTQLANFFIRDDYTIAASLANYVHLVFKTGDSVQGRGFSGSYQIYDYNAIVTEPQDGYIVSPGYPLKYPANSYFSWTIQGSPGSFIILGIWDLQIEDGVSCNDYVQVYDGNNSNTRTLAQLCSNKIYPAALMSTGSSLHVVLRSNSLHEYSGFMAKYQINKCQTFWDGSGASIASPGYPLENVETLSCSWRIITDTIKYYTLRITDLDLNETTNCTHNKLKIYDGGDINSPLLGTYCYALSGVTIVSTSNDLLLVFETDGSRKYKGFSATYSSTDYNLSVLLTSSPQIRTKEINFNWTSSTPAQLVTYTINWVAQEDNNNRGEMGASPSGVHVQGLTPGTGYNFTVLSTIQGDENYNSMTLPTNFTFETLPAPPGQLNESSSNLNNIPYVLRFESSEGRVARYNITVGGKSYEVFNPELTIKDLRPDTQYNYTITAYNKHGVGSDDITGSFKTEPAEREEESLNIALVAAVTAASGVVLIFAVVVVTLVIRKRRRNSKPSTSENNSDGDYDKIDMSRQSTVATSPDKSVKNELNTINSAKLSNVQVEQMEEQEYEYMNPAHTNDETYETPRPRMNVSNLDGQDLIHVYNNIGNVRRQP